jgi:hypothetical protein
MVRKFEYKPGCRQKKTGKESNHCFSRNEPSFLVLPIKYQGGQNQGNNKKGRFIFCKERFRRVKTHQRPVLVFPSHREKEHDRRKKEINAERQITVCLDCMN